MDNYGDIFNLERLSSGVVSPQLQFDISQEQTMHKHCLRRWDRLFVIAFRCPGCTDLKCLLMKIFMVHKENCQRKAIGGCHKCRNLKMLRSYHIKHCVAEECPVPKCALIRVKREITKTKYTHLELLLKRQRLVADLQEEIDASIKYEYR